MAWLDCLHRNSSIRRLPSVYEELIKIEPFESDGWRGLFLSYARDNQNEKALAVPGALSGRG